MARNKEFDPSERLATARNLFWKKGYHATSMQDLVSTMKVNRGGLYGTYGDKHQLFMSSLDSYAKETHEAYQSATVGETSPLKSIELIIKKAITRSFEEDKVCMAVKSAFELAPFDQEVKALLIKQFNDQVAVFETLLIKAQQAGEISSEKDAAQLARFIVGSFAGFWQMQNLFNNSQMVQQMSKILIASIK